MLRAARRLHSLVAYPGDFAFYVARPGRSVHSRVKASSVGVTDRRRQQSRGPFLQCVRGATPFEAGQTARDLGQPPRSYPWAMAPTINTRKLVATAIATFASTDKFIIFPSIMAATPMTPVFEFFLFCIASNFSALMDAKTKS